MKRCHLGVLIDSNELTSEIFLFFSRMDIFELWCSIGLEVSSSKLSDSFKISEEGGSK